MKDIWTVKNPVSLMPEVLLRNRKREQRTGEETS